jgi:hypothetical protein
MELLPFYLGGFGILVLSLVGFVWYQNEWLKKKLINSAHESLKSGSTDENVVAELLDQGIERPDAIKLVELAQQKIMISQSLEKLEQGKTDDEVQAQLQSTGLSEEQSLEILGKAQFALFCARRPIASLTLGIVMPVAGLALILGGIFLWYGNRSGLFVTFPYAGHLVIGIGVVLVAIGWKLMVITMSNRS